MKRQRSFISMKPCGCRTSNDSRMRWKTGAVILVSLVSIHAVVAAKDSGYDYDAPTFVTSEAQQQEAEEQRLHEIIVEDWYDLVRYLVGLGFCIFGLIGLYFHQFASYYFLKRYTNPNGIERKLGRVISCEPMPGRRQGALSQSASTVSSPTPEGPLEDPTTVKRESGLRKKGYRIFVVYNAAAPARRGLCGACGPDTSTISHSSARSESLMESEYFQWFRTSKQVPTGSSVSLILLKDNPKSACTPELLNSHLMLAFSEKNCCAISVLGISLVLGVIVLSLASVFEILSMPHPETQRPIGWSILISFSFLFVIAGWIFCKMLFDSFKAKVFLSAIPAPKLRLRQQQQSEAAATMACAPTLPRAQHISNESSFGTLQYTTSLNDADLNQRVPTSIPIENAGEYLSPDEEFLCTSHGDGDGVDLEKGELS